MSGETEKEVSGWTVDTLNMHTNDMLVALDRRINDRFHAVDKEVCNLIKCEQDRVNQHFVLLTEKVDQRFESIKEAVTKAETATEKRFESVNEFRNTLADQARELLSRNEFTTKVDAMNERLSDVVTRMDRRDGTGTGRKDMWGWAIGGAGLVLTLVSIAAMVMKFSGTVPS